MKRLLVILTLAATCEAQETQGTGGWENTHWGMTEQQIRELYPKATAYPKQPGAKLESLEIESFDLAGESFAAHFFFDASGGLNEVRFTKNSKSEFELIPARAKAESLLKQKYGTPSTRTADEIFLRVAWNKPDTTVSLDYTAIPLISTFMLAIKYQRPKADTP